MSRFRFLPFGKGQDIASWATQNFKRIEMELGGDTVSAVSSSSSNSRPSAPAAHSTTHESGGSDEVSLAQAQVVGLEDALADKVSKTETDEQTMASGLVLPYARLDGTLSPLADPAEGTLQYIAGELYVTIPDSDTTFTDSDGKVYDLITVNGLVWMVQNYNRTIADSYAYDNNDANAADGYGRQYKWADLATLAPSGWRVASNSDWNNLSTYLGGDTVSAGHLKSTTGWNPPNTGADDSVGFAMKPNGYRSNTGSYEQRGYYGYYWTSGEYSPTAGNNRIGVYNTAELFPSITLKTYYLSVRLVKDA